MRFRVYQASSPDFGHVPGWWYFRPDDYPTDLGPYSSGYDSHDGAYSTALELVVCQRRSHLAKPENRLTPLGCSLVASAFLFDRIA